MQRLRTVTSLDVSAVAGHHAMPEALLFLFGIRMVASVASEARLNKLFSLTIQS